MKDLRESSPPDDSTYRVMTVDEAATPPVAVKASPTDTDTLEPFVPLRPFAAPAPCTATAPPLSLRETADATPITRAVARRPRRRESHRGRPGHRRVRATRAGPDDDAGPSSGPGWRWAHSYARAVAA